MHLKSFINAAVIIAFALFPISAGAEKADTLWIHSYVSPMSFLADSILKGSTDSVRISSNAKLTEAMDSALKDPASFNYSFSVFKNMSVLTSDDRKLRIYTWTLPVSGGMEYRYSGFVQVNDEKKGLRLYKLSEIKYPGNQEAEFLRLNDSSWYGALYYKIIHRRFNKKDQYILLGWHGKDVYSTRKIIDNIVLSPSKIEFGKPVFKSGGKARSRIILEYNSSANVSLNYNESMKMIVHDHLSSSDPRPESQGMYQLYGPDMTYTGYVFKDGFWIMQKDIDVKNRQDTDPKDIKLHRELRMQRKE